MILVGDNTPFSAPASFFCFEFLFFFSSAGARSFKHYSFPNLMVLLFVFVIDTTSPTKHVCRFLLPCFFLLFLR